MTAETMTSNQTIVTEFLAAFEDLDVDRALTYVSRDIEYQNVPFPVVRGFDKFEKRMRGFTSKGTGYEAEIINIAANGPIVLTERIDVTIRKNWRARFWVCSTFEVRDGKIILWREHYDWVSVLASSVKGLFGAAVSGLRSQPYQKPKAKS
ncbi:limonene-1,2-epoxide hydrolase family protein [Actinomadura viridis]|uniref:limonene-1,2-epoxide hydrolase family protein n=1 Tax=Actinomadura viridis TaxID=58110 RepID=UPI003698E015